MLKAWSMPEGSEDARFANYELVLRRRLGCLQIWLATDFGMIPRSIFLINIYRDLHDKERGGRHADVYKVLLPTGRNAALKRLVLPDMALGRVKEVCTSSYPCIHCLNLNIK